MACMLLGFTSGTEYLSLSLYNHLKLPELSNLYRLPSKAL